MQPSDFFEVLYDDDWNAVGLRKISAEESNDAPNGDSELATIVYIPLQFELGSKPAVGGKNPSLGTGIATAEYTREEYTNGTRISLDIHIHNVGGSAGVGTGGYEVYLPDDIRPAKDIYSGHASLWLAGGGISEFDGSVKWTMRNQTKGPKLIFTFGGREWTANDPKPYNDFKLRANIRYFLR
ncbi:hypothetical protein LCGC14_2226720 [marine sediment metagenome]|uniref:Uncharacterized protein n=1 Tax=marine sediment metagenome TaxID=412755 RepID=A0A0F9DX12_9ZZZZ